MSEIEKPRNLPFVGREYPELKKANEREKGQTEKLQNKINEEAKEAIKRGQKAIEEMRNEVAKRSVANELEE